MNYFLFAFFLSFAPASSQHITPNLSLSFIAPLLQAQVASEGDEDLPFDNSTFLGKVFNWAARLFLWFIYLTIFLIAIAITQWFLTTKSFWSWIICAGGVFFYGMLLGRYWGYDTCLIIFAIGFTALKIYFTSVSGRQKSKGLAQLFSQWNPFKEKEKKASENRLNQEPGNYDQNENS